MAYRSRPQNLRDFVGWANLVKSFPFLAQSNLPPFILLRPAWISGKTTLACFAHEHNEIYPFSAVLAGIPELKNHCSASEVKNHGEEKRPLIDEIHRFNKSQQDALLPYVEKGDFILIGATTVISKAAINPPYCLACSIAELKRLTP